MQTAQRAGPFGARLIVLNEVAGNSDIVQSRLMKALAEPAAVVEMPFGNDNPWQIHGNF